MINFRQIFVIGAMAIGCVPVVFSQTENKFKVTPTGRVLMDGAVFVSPDKEEFKDGMAIPDVRLGLKGSYGNWSGKIDVSFAGGKVGIKDLNFQYNFDNENFLRAGNFIHQYGYQVSTSSSLKPTFEEPISNTLFNTGRQIGVMYQHSEKEYFGTVSFHMEPNTITTSPDDMNGEGIGVLSRQIWRPVITGDGTMFQVGISGGWANAQTRGSNLPHDGFSFSANFPTRVNKVAAEKITLTNAKNMWKFTPELMAAYGPVALEAQYFFNRVNMKDDLHSWTGQGVYADVRTLLLGDNYTYSMADGGIATPKPGSLELVLLYNYSTLSDSKAQYKDTNGNVQTGIFGGRTNTVSATMTYYINKYFLARLNYAYTHRWDASSMSGFNGKTDFSVIQARLQFIF